MVMDACQRRCSDARRRRGHGEREKEREADEALGTPERASRRNDDLLAKVLVLHTLFASGARMASRSLSHLLPCPALPCLALGGRVVHAPCHARMRGNGAQRGEARVGAARYGAQCSAVPHTDYARRVDYVVDWPGCTASSPRAVESARLCASGGG